MHQGFISNAPTFRSAGQSGQAQKQQSPFAPAQQPNKSDATSFQHSGHPVRTESIQRQQGPQGPTGPLGTQGGQGRQGELMKHGGSYASSRVQQTHTPMKPVHKPDGTAYSVKYLTCWYWAQGQCKKPEYQCAYSHYDTGVMADEPVQKIPGCK